jgi:PadR family transcriptional regulator, regulatory protein PadR
MNKTKAVGSAAVFRSCCSRVFRGKADGQAREPSELTTVPPIALTGEGYIPSLPLSLPREGQLYPIELMSSSKNSGDLLQGTLGLLILKSLLLGPSHGYTITRWIEEMTGDVLSIEEGSLYPALRRLEDRGWVASEWGVSENNRRARFYTLTQAGRKHLRSEASVWIKYSQAVTRVLRAEPAVV